MDYSKLSDYAAKVSLAAVLMFILYAGSTDMWVYGSVYKQALADRDIWKQLALKGVTVAQVASMPQVVGANPAAAAPLPTDAKAADVAAKLEQLEKSQYVTEPTDKPLP